MKTKKTSNSFFFKLIASFTIFMTAGIFTLVSSSKTVSATNVDLRSPIVLKENVVNEMRVCDETSVTLSSNASTGYAWDVTFSKSGILDLVSSEYIETQTQSDPVIVGAPGKQVFKLKAVAPGNCTLTFKYFMPYAGVESATETIVYHINVLPENVLPENVLPENGSPNGEISKINTVKISDTFIVKLPSNSSTGYSWSYTASDPKIISLISSDYVASSDIPGAPGTQVFTFEPTTTGNVTLTFKYYRPFEGIKSYSKTVVCDIQIVNP